LGWDKISGIEGTSTKTPKHTPSPWRIDNEGIHPLIRGQANEVVAKILVHTYAMGATAEEIHANTSLIAAAPELLAVAKQAIEALMSFPGVDNYIQLGAGSGMTIRDARAAIAKAEGRA
jgi:hypothetical protein